MPQRLRILRQRRHRRPLLGLLQGEHQEEAAAPVKHAQLSRAVDVALSRKVKSAADSQCYDGGLRWNSLSNSLVSRQGKTLVYFICLYFQTRYPVSVIISASTSKTQLLSDLLLHRFIAIIFYFLTNRMKKYIKQKCICGTPIKICFTCEAPYSLFNV